MGFLVWASIITFVIVIGIAALGGMLTEKSGVVNLSIEGFMTIGAISYSLLIASSGGKYVDNTAWQWLFFPLAGLFTAVFSLIYGYVTVYLKANQTIAGIALNTFALALSIFLIKSRGQGERIDINNNLWTMGSSDSFGWIINIAVLMGIPLIALFILFLNYTKEGKKIKAVGENPHAAASLGINVQITRMKAIMISSFVVGIAGAMFAQQLSKAFYGSVQGIGFLAVAIVIFGQWKPLFIACGAILFGTIYGAVSQSVLIPWLAKSMSKELLNMIPYVISLTVLIFTSKNSKAPKALGIPYVNAGR